MSFAWDWQAGIPHGTVHTHVFHSKQLGVPREVVVYTPPGYEKGTEKLPLLVLQREEALSNEGQLAIRAEAFVEMVEKEGR